ncbi:unnamed protein product, partial [Didymodactylos carnosus]
MGCGSSICSRAKQQKPQSSTPKSTSKNISPKSGRLPPINQQSSTSTSTVTTKNKSTKNISLNYDRSQNLETFSIVWLDRNIHDFDDVDDIQKEFRAIIDYIQLFDRLEKCEDYMKKAKEDKIYFIVSQEYAPNIISHIHDLQQVQTIYIFSLGQENNAREQRTKHYSK